VSPTVALLLAALAEPARELNDDTVRPGWLGFAAFLILGAAFVLLMRSMVVHMRRIKPDPESDEEPMEPDDPPRA